jgi:AbrB family looped-hinge helix DNA binding protein
LEAAGESRLPDDPIITVAKVLPRGAVQLPPEVRARLGLKPGTKLIMVTTEDALVIKRADAMLNRQPARGIVKRLKAMFSRV